jgi:hypothetical protein
MNSYHAKCLWQKRGDDGLSPNETLDMISEDEATANTGDENDTEREARRARNRAREPGEGGSTSAYNLCIVNWTPNSPL